MPTPSQSSHSISVLPTRQSCHLVLQNSKVFWTFILILSSLFVGFHKFRSNHRLLSSLRRQFLWWCFLFLWFWSNGRSSIKSFCWLFFVVEVHVGYQLRIVSFSKRSQRCFTLLILVSWIHPVQISFSQTLFSTHSSLHQFAFDLQAYQFCSKLQSIYPQITKR